MLRTQTHAPHGATLHPGAIAAMMSSSGMTAERGRTASTRHPNLGENEQHSALNRHDRDRHHGGFGNNGRTTQHGTIDGPSNDAQTLMFGTAADPSATAMTANFAGATIGLLSVEPGARLLN